MPKSSPFKIQRLISETGTGTIHQALDATGKTAHLFKFRSSEGGLDAVEDVAMQVSIGRLNGIHHPSMRQVIGGGTDPKDGSPCILAKPMKARVLADQLKLGPLSVETATQMFTQLLELSELLSQLLAEDGVWLETQTESILITGEGEETRFVFWPSPIKALVQQDAAHDFNGLINLAEQVMNWEEREVDEREGGHLQLWLKWLKEATEGSEGSGTTIRETREMLAAAAGVEPPDPIEELVEASTKPPAGVQLAQMIKTMKLPVPKMPLFALLTVMLIIQACIGWFIVRQINDSIDDEIRKLNEDYTAHPYTIDLDPSRADEPGAQPLEFE
ncbi:MAG: hypothetical protein R3242_05150 [Akkermansiaceae bacterium]|nr:hypothetical protein [Akkermansiaceae bacterium]